MNTEKTQTVKTIDLNPGWETAVRIYCAVLQNPDAEPSTKWDAEQELLKLGKWADKKMTEKNHE